MSLRFTKFRLRKILVEKINNCETGAQRFIFEEDTFRKLNDQFYIWHHVEFVSILWKNAFKSKAQDIDIDM